MKELVLIVILSIAFTAIGHYYGAQETEGSPTYQIGKAYIKEFDECFNSETNLTLGYCMENTTIVGPLPEE